MAVIKLNEGNPVSMNLPPSIDSFLQDVAQVTEKITYTDISNFEKRCTKSDFSQLRKLRRKFADAMEDWDDEALDDIGQKVADIVLGTEIKESVDEDDFDGTYTSDMSIASEISKNNAGELTAIEGYQELLTIVSDDPEAVDIINEIIADEKNHIEKLNELMLKYDSIKPNKE